MNEIEEIFTKDILDSLYEIFDSIKETMISNEYLQSIIGKFSPKRISKST
jgi:hypothetical protein